MNQKLSDWAAIAEIISSSAVVVTLIFLIVEIAGNTEATLAANRQSVASRVETILLAATSPELAAVIEKATEEVPLDALELRIYNGYVAARIRNAEEAFLQYQDGHLSEQYFLTRATSALGTLDNSQARQLWERWRTFGYFTLEFSDWLDEALQERHGQ